jgi:hypothetical protein
MSEVAAGARGLAAQGPQGVPRGCPHAAPWPLRGKVVRSQVGRRRGSAGSITDPATLLPTGGLVHNLPLAACQPYFDLELLVPDVNRTGYIEQPHIPPVVYIVAARARAALAGRDEGVPSARVRTRAGRGELVARLFADHHHDHSPRPSCATRPERGTSGPP